MGGRCEDAGLWSGGKDNIGPVRLFRLGSCQGELVLTCGYPENCSQGR